MFIRKNIKIKALILSILLLCALLVPAMPVFAADVSMYIDPADQTVDAGESFTVNVYVSSDTVTRGAQCDLVFDPELVQVDSVAEGTFYNSSYGTYFQSPTIDNSTGIIEGAAVACTSGYPNGPTGSGVFLVVNMTALDDVNGTSALELENVVIGDADANSLSCSVTDGQVVVGTGITAPDLIVSDIYTEWYDEEAGLYIIYYTVTNQGDVDAEASTTEIDIDGSSETYDCTALSVGESHTYSVGNFTLDGDEDTITITVDCEDVITESNEVNNTQLQTVSLSKMIIQGSLSSSLLLTIPDSILSWSLEVGDNSKAGTLNVKCNTDWNVTVSDESSSTDGHMTQWDGNDYGDYSLDDPMEVVNGTYTVSLDEEDGGVIAAGTPDGQEDDNSGEDVELTFNQLVKYGDKVLDTDEVYRIVITFTGEMTF